MKKQSKFTKMLNIIEDLKMEAVTRADMWKIWTALDTKPSYRHGEACISTRLNEKLNYPGSGYGEWLRPSCNESRYFKIIATKPRLTYKIVQG